MSIFKFDLGRKAKDTITGFQGTITGRAQYMTGCNQYVLQPSTDNGKWVDGQWFDENRLELLPNEEKVTVPTDEVKGGPRNSGEQAPLRG